MEFICFHLMPYRPLDMASAQAAPLGLGGAA